VIWLYQKVLARYVIIYGEKSLLTYIHTPLSDLLAGVEPEQVTRDYSSNLEEEFVIVNEGLWWTNEYSFIKKILGIR
jgi:hypothetical protein